MASTWRRAASAFSAFKASSYWWVELSRHWAARGVPTVRIDFEGIGDSDGDELQVVSNKDLYSQQMVDHTLGRILDLFDIETTAVSRWGGLNSIKNGDS